MKNPFAIILTSIVTLLTSYEGLTQAPGLNFVELEDGQRVNAKEIRYVNPPFKSPYLLVDNRSKLQLSKVKSYQNEKGFFLRGSLPPQGEIGFAKRISKGEVSTYEKTTTTYMSGPYSYGGVHRNDYYTKGKSGLRKINIRNLTVDLSDNAASLSHLKKAKNIGMIQNVFYGLGAACIVYGIASFASQDSPQVDDGPSFPPTLIAAPVLFLIPLPLNFTKKDHLKSAIRIYNESH